MSALWARYFYKVYWRDAFAMYASFGHGSMRLHQRLILSPEIYLTATGLRSKKTDKPMGLSTWTLSGSSFWAVFMAYSESLMRCRNSCQSVHTARIVSTQLISSNFYQQCRHTRIADEQIKYSSIVPHTIRARMLLIDRKRCSNSDTPYVKK